MSMFMPCSQDIRWSFHRSFHWNLMILQRCCLGCLPIFQGHLHRRTWWGDGRCFNIFQAATSLMRAEESFFFWANYGYLCLVSFWCHSDSPVEWPKFMAIQEQVLSGSATPYYDCLRGARKAAWSGNLDRDYQRLSLFMKNMKMWLCSFGAEMTETCHCPIAHVIPLAMGPIVWGIASTWTECSEAENITKWSEKISHWDNLTVGGFNMSSGASCYIHGHNPRLNDANMDGLNIC